MALSSLQKAGRVKVGVRCRPAFQDEIDFAKGDFISIVDTRTEAINDPSLGQLSLTLISGKQREFLYDYVFSSDATQDQVYNRIAQPVVADVLKGFNGTIFAYGQTGTGKVYKRSPLWMLLACQVSLIRFFVVVSSCVFDSCGGT